MKAVLRWLGCLLIAASVELDDRPGPFHAAEISRILWQKNVIVVENTYSGQFARYLRSETGFDAQGFIQ